MSRPSFTIDSSDFERAAKALTKAGFETQAGRTIAYANRRSVNVVRRTTRARLKPHRRTGKMRDHIRTRVRGIGFDSVAGVRSTGVGSNLLVGGTRPHTYGARAPMPMWAGRGSWKRGEGAGVLGFARKVNHPGTKADPFFRDGIHDAAGEIKAIRDKAAQTMANELAYRLGGRTHG